MADTKASAEAAAAALGGPDGWAGVQGGADVFITVTQVMAAVLTLLGDTDASLAANSDSKLATQKAIKSFVTNLVGALAPLASPALTGTPTVPTASLGDNTTKAASTAFVSSAITAALASEMVYKGTIDCSGNPNYPAATSGWVYVVGVAGLIGGGSGVSVGAGDVVICKVTNAGGSQASVGADFDIVHASFTVFTGGTLSSPLNEAPPTSLASAATVNIGAAAANTINISGTTNISAFDAIAAGAMRRLVFGGVLTIAYNATSMILPTAANIVTEAGDVAEFESLGSGNWRCTSYLRADGTALTSSGSFTGGTLASALNEAPPVTIASASTVAIGAAAANTINISGTTAITGFDSIAAGAMRRVIFAGALTLTYNATSLVLPTAANITTAAGDVAEFESLGSGNWRCTTYQRKDGTALTASSFTGGTLTSALNEAPAVTIASSSTPAIFAAAGNSINLTGTTTVTGFDAIAAGAVRRVIFAAPLQLTNNATSMQNITGANIQALAGDVAEFESLGSGNTKMLSYTRADGTTLAPLSRFRVKAYGAKTDGKRASDGVANNTTAFSSASASFTSADVGKLFELENATGSVVFETTIAGFTDGQHITLAGNPGFSATGCAYVYGTDDTTAVQAAINAMPAQGGILVLEPGICCIGGALQDTSRSNSQIVLPIITVVAGVEATVVIEGVLPPPIDISVIGATPLPVAHSILKSFLNTGSGTAPAMVGGWGPSGSAGNFTAVHLVWRNATARMPSNPVLTAVDLSHCVSCDVDGFVADVGSYYVQGLTQPTTSTSYGLKTPENNNGANTKLGTVNVIGFYHGARMCEHACGVGQVAAWGCYKAFEFPFAYHALYFGRLMAVHCPTVLCSDGSGIVYVKIEELDIEHAASGWWAPAYDVDDASNYIYGAAPWHVVLAASGVSHTFTKNGGTNLVTTEIGTKAPVTVPIALQVACSDRVTALTTATDVANIRAPLAFSLTGVRASLDTASSSGLPQINVKKNGTTVFSTNLTINASAKTSVGATTPAVLTTSPTPVSDDDEFTIDIVAAGTGAKGLIVTLLGTASQAQ